MNYEEKTINSTCIYKGKVINLKVDDVVLPNGKTVKREIITHCGAVGIVAVDENNNTYLVNQFRKAAEREFLEIPAGKIDPGEAPAECAKRELKEETGFASDDLTSLGSIYVSPGYCNEVIHLFLAQNLKKGELSLDEDEFLHTVCIPFKEALELALNGKMSDAKSVVALLRANEILN